VVLHGGPGADHSDFLPFLGPLARRNQLILIDERGSGRSERLQDPSKYTLDAMVDDLRCVRRAFGLKRFALLGAFLRGHFGAGVCHSVSTNARAADFSRDRTQRKVIQCGLPENAGDAIAESACAHDRI
jgi:hypothetical protein